MLFDLLLVVEAFSYNRLWRPTGILRSLSRPYASGCPSNVIRASLNFMSARRRYGLKYPPTKDLKSANLSGWG